MANPLTGDYDIVLQVSGSTINRLVATMHQNTDARSERPSFPHSVVMRIGDPTPIDGMRGTTWAQLSVPRIELIHGEDGRFNLEVGIRARYRPDPGTIPLPEFIYGTIKAQYRIDKIDPSCFGWAQAAADYLWIRVVGPTVAFDGSAVDETKPSTLVQPPDPAAIDARITRLAGYLLKTTFQATPQKVGGRFGHGSMRSLNVGVDRSAVAVPLAGQGQLSSVKQEFLGGRDFGVAVSKTFILATIKRELDALVKWFDVTFHARTVGNPDFGVESGAATIDATWRITLTSVDVSWAGGTLAAMGSIWPDSLGLITIKVSGQMVTQRSILNLTFDATQLVMFTFGGNEAFVVSLVGSPSVNVSGPLAFLVTSEHKAELGKKLEPFLENEVAKLAGSLSVKDRKTELVNQLKKLDPSPNTYFDEAVFSPDGVVVRGRISLSQRRAAESGFVTTSERDGFDAFESWIPGGRITSFDWTWSWTNSNQSGGSESDRDRFLLRRPGALHRSRFGKVKDLTRPLPVLDGFGSMCLTIKAERIHSDTGALVPVVVTRRCMRAGFDIRVQGVAGGRVLLKDWTKRQCDSAGSVQEVSIIDVGGRRTDRAPNTLVIRAGERWDHNIGVTLREALLNARRVGAGLQVLLLFRDGTLTTPGNPIDEISQLAADLEAPLLINEDVRGTWSGGLAMDPRGGDVQWRLVTPTGGVSWAHRGAIDAEDLARALDAHLFPGPPPSPRLLSNGIAPGSRIQTSLFDAYVSDANQHFEVDDRCPPPLGPFTFDARVLFVQRDSVASQAAVERLAREYAEREGDRPFVAVIVDGANGEDLDRLEGRIPEDFFSIPDPRGSIAARFSVRTWPTRLTVKEGVVTAVDVGHEPERPGDSEPAS